MLNAILLQKVVSRLRTCKGKTSGKAALARWSAKPLAGASQYCTSLNILASCINSAQHVILKLQAANHMFIPPLYMQAHGKQPFGSQCFASKHIWSQSCQAIVYSLVIGTALRGKKMFKGNDRVPILQR